MHKRLIHVLLALIVVLGACGTPTPTPGAAWDDGSRWDQTNWQ